MACESMIPTTRIVLQGEFAIVDGSKSLETIKTPHAYTCTVFSLYNPMTKLAVLAHFDDYTDIKASLEKIELILKIRFKADLNHQFKAKLVEGLGSDIVSEFFNKRKISIWTMVLLKFKNHRPHLSIRPQDGASIVIDNTNYPLEYLQRR
jgi:hypothetical protein